MVSSEARSRRGLSAFRLLSGAMAALFVLSAALQWNDPDPALWMALYLGAATVAAAGALERIPFGVALAATLVFAVLTALGAPSLATARSEAFTSFRMLDAQDEAPRETLGLALAALWSGAVSVAAWRRRFSA